MITAIGRRPVRKFRVQERWSVHGGRLSLTTCALLAGLLFVTGFVLWRMFA